MLNNCVKCHRWKVFNDKPCSVHPEFKTDKDVQAEKEQRANDNLTVMFYVAGLRVYAAMGRLYEFRLLEMKLALAPQRIQDAVLEEVKRLGPMTEEELSKSLSLALYLNQKYPRAEEKEV